MPRMPTATDPELDNAMERLSKAKCAEDVFGAFFGGKHATLLDVRRVYRRLAKVAHPDRYPSPGDREVATAAFKLLDAFWQTAQRRIESGMYGSPIVAVISTRRRRYEVGSRIARGDIADVYGCTYADDAGVATGIIKVARSGVDNDLMANEARVLKMIETQTADVGLRAYAPCVVESFGYSDGKQPVRQATVFAAIDGLRTLMDVRCQYPDGIDPKHAAWMWTRLLIALDVAHAIGVVHGSVIPPHVLIHPAEHGLVLVDWTNATRDPEASGERVKAISSEYESWYPRETIAGEAPTPGMDILMGARCMIYLLGGDPVEGTLPDRVPPKLKNFFRACMFESSRMRPQDAGKLREEFHELIELLWGKRKFIAFSMA